MSSCPPACKTLPVSPSSRGHPSDPAGMILAQCGCLTHDPGQMFGPELGLMEMPDVPDVRSSVISPLTTTQAIDLSTSTDEHCVVIPGERTPASYGEVPGFVLARVRGADSLTEPGDNGGSSSQQRATSAARVCLERRFNSLSADTPRQQDIQSALLTNLWTMLQQSAEAQEAALHSQMHKWMKTDRINPLDVSSPFLGGGFNPVSNTCEQVIPVMVEPNRHPDLQQLVNTQSDVAPPAALKKHPSTHSSQPVAVAPAAPDSAGESGNNTRKTSRPHMSHIQRRERHNSRERERRKRIRLCCDELNLLVPFCESDTDKATTLQWTAAFLRYLNKTYGDTFKEEFQKTFTDERGHFLKPCPSSDQDPIHREMDDTLGFPLAVEQ